MRQTRKRRISIESEEEDERDDIDKESDEENEAQNENGGKKVRSKRRKKTGHMNPKVSYRHFDSFSIHFTIIHTHKFCCSRKPKSWKNLCNKPMLISMKLIASP